MIKSSDDKVRLEGLQSLCDLNKILKMFFSKTNLHIPSELKSVLLTETYILLSALKFYKMRTVLHYLNFSEEGV